MAQERTPIDMPDNLHNAASDSAREVSRSLSALVRSSRNLAETSASVIERELAMVIKVSEQLRDELFAADTLARARKEPIPARFRADAHRAVDIAADLGSVMWVTGFRFAEAIADAVAGQGNTTASSPVIPAH
jgi:hypothetical protein